ncbi:hypothetical protein [Rhizobium sp. N324]|uniref:hypothetical protein n=1 Tax=Rhizobium sp. N324 TaxID=1703969 RepID=UPI003FA71682
MTNTPRPEDIAAIEHHSATATGHVSVVTGLGVTTGTVGFPAVIGTTNWGFRAFRVGQQPSFRTFDGN